MNEINHNNYRFPFTTTKRVLLLMCMVLLGMVVVGLLTVLFPMPMRSQLLLGAALQQILAFAVPAVACAWLFYKRPWQGLSLDRVPELRWIAAIVVVYVVSLPAMNYLVWLNEQMHLPGALSAVEVWMRQAEQNAKDVTNLILNAHSITDFLTALVVVGLLAGVGEEFLFRGGLLNFVRSSWGMHASVWFVAFVFSAIHFQFYGFFPRLLLGAWLGYLLVWTGSLWIPIFAHVLNNSMVVLATYLSNNRVIDVVAIDQVGVPRAGDVPLLAIGSLITTAVVVWLMLNRFRPRH